MNCRSINWPLGVRPAMALLSVKVVLATLLAGTGTNKLKNNSYGQLVLSTCTTTWCHTHTCVLHVKS